MERIHVEAAVTSLVLDGTAFWLAVIAVVAVAAAILWCEKRLCG